MLKLFLPLNIWKTNFMTGMHKLTRTIGIKNYKNIEALMWSLEPACVNVWERLSYDLNSPYMVSVLEESKIRSNKIAVDKGTASC